MSVAIDATGHDGTRPTAAAIDIGSNSIKMTIGHLDGLGGIEQVGWASEVVRLGEGLDRSGRLDEGRVDLAVDTLRRFEQQAREMGATTVVAVATEATRAAANGADFLRRVRDETGIDVRIIDGDEEAALTFRGLAAVTDVGGTVVVADIGGGSTEIIVAQDGAVLGARSLPLGSGRLTDRFVKSNPPAPPELEASKQAASEALDGAADILELAAKDGLRLIVVGGTGEFMARLVPDERTLDAATIDDVLSRLSELTAAELAEIIAAPEARARVLPAGVAVVSALVTRIAPRGIELARSGIRVGLLLDALLEGRAKRALPALPGNGKSRSKQRPTTPSDNGRAPAVEAAFCETMRTLIADRWDAVWRTIPAALEGADIEGVHDVRVASRRLRAAMDIGVHCFPPRWYKPLHQAAKEITSALGEVRDRDVLLEALQADRDAAPLAEQPGIDRLVARVERERSSARTEMERFLESLTQGQPRRDVERRFGAGKVRPQGSSERVGTRL